MTDGRPEPETRLGNDARTLASRLRRAEAKLEAARDEIEHCTRELSVMHRKTCERFGFDVPADAFLLDVLEQIDVADDDVWLWRGTRNNKGLPTIKFVDGRRNQERSLVRHLAIVFGLIGEDDHGTLHPTGSVDDVNPWHRTLRRSAEPNGNRWRFQPKPEEG